MDEVTDQERFMLVLSEHPDNATPRHFWRRVQHYHVDTKVIEAKASGHWPPPGVIAICEHDAAIVFTGPNGW